MGIIWDIARVGKNIWNKAKWVFTQQPTTVTPEKTLNETIIENEQQPTPQVGSFPNTLNNQINTWIIQTPVIQSQINQNTATLSAPTTETQRRGNIWARNNISGFNINEPLSINEQIQEEANADKWFSMPDFVWFGEKLVWNIADWGNRQTAANRYNAEVEENSKDIILDYNPTTNRVIKLTPTDEWAFNARAELYLSELAAATTYEEQQAARQSFYNDMKDGGFKAQAVPNTKKFSGWKTYSDDTLSSVMGNNVKTWVYPITQEQFDAYLETLDENDEIRRTAYEKYKDDMTAWLDEVDLTETEEANNFMQKFSDIAKKDTLDLINKNLASKERWEAIRNVDEIVSDPANRLLTSEMYLKRLRDEAAQTPELQRTQRQRDIIYNYDVVWKQLMDKYASNVNDYLLLQLNEWVNDKWEISDALWRFEDGRELNDILRDWLGDIAGIEIWWLETFWKVSAIDIMRRFANEAAYNYRQGKLSQSDNPWESILNTVKSGRNQFEHWQEPIWEQWAEAWQSIWRLWAKLTNTISSAPQWRLWWNSPASAYWDADFSVGKLIETDDSPNRRTVKKYGLQFWEYIPEWLWAVAPDIALTVATSGWSTPSLLRSAWTFSRWIRNFNRVQNILKKSNIAARGLDTTLRWLDRVWEIWRNLWNINSWEKRVLNIADRALSQFAVWQSMDAKLSAFDTEPYSDTSFWLSMWGSLLWDILPEAKDIWWAMRTWLKWWRAWTKWTWVWDLVDFINQSDENALLIARQMWKNTANFSEQDLKNYIRAYATVTDAAKKVYDELTAEWKAAANSWTKELMYNYVKQAYLPNSRIWKAVRVLVENQSTNPADIIKYIWNIPWTVSIWPYQSVIKLKQWTMAWVQAKEWWYDVALDVVDRWFGNKVSEWFTLKDIQDISKLSSYDDVLKNKDKYFRKITEKVGDWDRARTIERWVLTEDGLDRFWLEAKNLTLASLWIEISWAENVKEIFKEKMKWLEGMKLSDDTIDALADNWGYNEVVSKIENVLC